VSRRIDESVYARMNIYLYVCVNYKQQHVREKKRERERERERRLSLRHTYRDLFASMRHSTVLASRRNDIFVSFEFQSFVNIEARVSRDLSPT